MAETKTFTFPFSVDNRTDYGNILTQLNNKIDNIKKKVSYFDAYNISGAVVDNEQLTSQLNALPINQSLVINTSPFSLNGATYSPGDILLKLSTGEVMHIKSQTGGVFYPFRIQQSEDGGSYTLEYAYSGSAPVNKEYSVDYSDEENKDAVAEFAEKITFTGVKDTEKNDIYGIWKEVINEWVKPEDYTGPDQYFFTFKTYSTSPDDNSNPRFVKPFLQFYFCSNIDSTRLATEQFSIDYSLSIVTINSIDYWKVSIDYIPENLWVKVK